MDDIILPPGCNYIAAFLTFRCSFSCAYCINGSKKCLPLQKELSGKDWVCALNRISPKPDLPVTLQGGEPSLHEDFYYIIKNVRPDIKLDILTNLEFDVDEFMRQIPPERLKRKAPYASIRVSYHPENSVLDDLLRKSKILSDAGYSIGIWAIKHPAHEALINQARKMCLKLGLDFRVKEFLGKHEGRILGTYRYKDSCMQKKRQTVKCKTSELIIGPDGKVYRCHYDLYNGMIETGNMLDERFAVQDSYLTCDNYGFCNPCDVKLKTDRFQRFGHASVQIIGDKI